MLPGGGSAPPRSPSATGVNWFSQAALNPDGEHLIAYDLSAFGPLSFSADLGASVTELSFRNPVLLGSEDLPLPGDLDYDNTIFLVELEPVPPPAPPFC
jgi:hypothetical protein